MTSPTAPAAPSAEPAAAPAPETAAPASAPVVETSSPFFARSEPATETTQPAATETQEPAKPAATEPSPAPSWQDALAGVPEADLEANETIKSLLNRREESRRQTDERVRLEAETQARREYVASDKFVRDFESLARETAATVDDAGNLTLNQERVDSMFRVLIHQGAEVAVNAIGAVMAADVGSDFAPTPEESELLKAATLEYQRDPAKNAGALVRQWTRMRDRALAVNQTAELRTTIEREVRAEFESKAAEETARAARETTRQTGGPAPTGGTPTPGTWATQRQIDAAHALGPERGGITTETYRQLNADGTYRRLPR